MVLLLWVEKKRIAISPHTNPRPTFINSLSQKPGTLFGTWLFLHACGRLIMEHYREDFRGPELSGESLSTWVSLVLIAAILIYTVSRYFASKGRNESQREQI